MGGGSKAPATTTTIQKTELPPWLEGVTRENIAIADEISKRPFQPYQGQLTAGFSPEQEAAFRYMQEGVGMTTPLYQQAAQTAADVSQFSPERVTSSLVEPSQIGFERVAADRIGFDRVGSERIGYDRVGSGQADFERVNAPSFLQGDINAYMNPYISNVENAALDRLDRATRTAVNRLGDQARQAGAFGGSRQGIAEGVALGESARSAGELSANLRSQAFNQAAGLLQTDQQRAMQAALSNQAFGAQTSQFNVDSALRAALANQQAGITTGQANQQTALQAALANQSTGLAASQINAENALRASLANQQSGLTAGQANQQTALQAALANQNTGLQADMANQNAGLQAGNLRLNAAGQLQNVAQGAQASRLQDASALEQIGMQRQAQQQALLDEAYGRFLEERNYPIDMLNLRLGATSSTPYSSTSTTQSTSPRQSGNALMTGLGAAGTVASIGASLATIF
jgi:hypothetical protein